MAEGNVLWERERWSRVQAGSATPSVPHWHPWVRGHPGTMAEMLDLNGAFFPLLFRNNVIIQKWKNSQGRNPDFSFL